MSVASASELTAPTELAPGLWLAHAALTAAAAAATRCPEALPLAAAGFRAHARQQAFLAGRVVAASALAALGAPTAVGRYPDGRPHWPAGVVGSLAHDAARAVAVVGDARRWQAVGVDVEPDEPLPADAASVALRPEDTAALRAHFGAAAERHSRLVFAAKECVHKVLHPLHGAWLEFDAVRVEWQGGQQNDGHWQALPVTAAAQQAFAGLPLQGRWWRAEGALWALLPLARSARTAV